MRRITVAALVLCLPALVWAHAAMVRADPGPRAVVGVAPTVIKLWFNEPVEQDFAKVSLENDGRAVVEGVGRPYVDKADSKLLIVPVPKLAPGSYKVKYKVLSVDGHIVDWGYTFRVKSQEPAQ